MKTNFKNTRLLILLGAAASLLLIPLVAMQFTNEVSWSAFDFAIASIILLGTVIPVELVLQSVTTKSQRIWMICVLIILLLLVWAELAVGIFGSPFAGS